MKKDDRRDLTVVKLGGSLITDKGRPETARPEVIGRLAEEIARARAVLGDRGEGLIVGHGSGSFGHVAAKAARIPEGIGGAEQLPGVSHTHGRAAALHRLVVEALEGAGACPFSIPPSACLVTAAGRVVSLALEPLGRALELGLMPVVYGDVVMDRRQGAAIASTEVVLATLARRLGRRGYRVARALWLGETEGFYDAAGRTVARLDGPSWRRLRAAAGAAAGTDVTGGMRLRLETAWALARRGIPSLLLDGTVPGRLERALLGEEVPGTLVAR